MYVTCNNALYNIHLLEDVVTNETASINGKSDSEDEVKSKLPQVFILLQLKKSMMF